VDDLQAGRQFRPQGVAGPNLAPHAQEKTAEEIMKEQEAMMMAKYGGMKPKKKGLLNAKVLFVCGGRSYFSARTWAWNSSAGSCLTQVSDELITVKLGW
jgi:hypothetical protein